MAETVKLIPKRKMDWLPQTDAFIQHIDQFMGQGDPHQIREINANDALPVLTLDQDGSGYNLLCEATTPGIRWAATAQTDPAGRFLSYVSGTDFHLNQALTADWATHAPFLKCLGTAKAAYLMTPVDDGRTFIYGGTTATGSPYIVLHGKTYSSNPGDILFYTGNAALSSNTLRFKIDGKVNATTVYCYGNMVAEKYYGDDASDLTIFGNATLTYPTERSIVLRVLDAGNDLWPACITITPNGASPTMDFNLRPISNLKLGGAMDANSNLINSVTDPVSAQDAATKNWVENTAIIPATNVEVAELSTATYDDVQDFINFFGDRTILSGGGITAHGDADGKVVIAACTAWCKITDDEDAVGKFFDYGGKLSQTLTDQQANFIYLDYNEGTPQVVVGTALLTYSLKLDHILLGVVFRDGTTVHIHNSDYIGISGIGRSNLHWTEHFAVHRVAGAVTSSTGTRNLDVTAGVVYAGLSRNTSNAFNTASPDTFTYWYSTDGGTTWAKVSPASTQIDNLQYNLTSDPWGLATLSAASRYGVHWVYLDNDGVHLHVVYGQGNYTANQAEEAGVPSSLPSLVTNYCVLIAKIIVQKSQDTLLISYPWTAALTTSLATDHDLLANVASSTSHTNYVLITDLEDTPTEDEADKATTSEYIFDHNAARTGVHSITGNISSISKANKSIYVDKEATGAADGTSYTDAFTTIQDAVDSMEDVVIHTYTIYVRDGTKKTGTCDSDEANKIADTGEFLAATTWAGRRAFNVDDGTWGVVSARDDDDTLSIVDTAGAALDLCPDGDEAYVIEPTPYRETVYLNSDPTNYPAHLILGSVTIEAEYYWYGTCEANVNAGEIVDSTQSNFSGIEVGDKVFVIDRNGLQDRCQDYEVGTVDDISQIGSDIVRTTLTKTPTTKWSYAIVKTEISGSDDGEDSGTARNACFDLEGINNVTKEGFLMTLTEDYAVEWDSCLSVELNGCMTENCDRNITAAYQTSGSLTHCCLHADTGYSGINCSFSSFLFPQYCAVYASNNKNVFYISDSCSVRMYYSIIASCNVAVEVYLASGFYLYKGEIDATVTKGVLGGWNATGKFLYATNDATTPEDPAGTTDGVYIG